MGTRSDHQTLKILSVRCVTHRVIIIIIACYLLHNTTITCVSILGTSQQQLHYIILNYMDRSRPDCWRNVVCEHENVKEIQAEKEEKFLMIFSSFFHFFLLLLAVMCCLRNIIKLRHLLQCCVLSTTGLVLLFLCSYLVTTLILFDHHCPRTLNVRLDHTHTQMNCALRSSQLAILHLRFFICDSQLAAIRFYSEQRRAEINSQVCVCVSPA